MRGFVWGRERNDWVRASRSRIQRFDEKHLKLLRNKIKVVDKKASN